MTEINKEIEEMARLIGCKDRTCEDCLSQSKTLFGDNKCALIEYAKGLVKAGYHKESEEEINKIIITAKRKLYDANLESVNSIVGEREKDIKQAWQNGYNKAREEVVKEFVDKVLKDIGDAIDHNTRLMESSHNTNLATYHNALITNNACKGIYDMIQKIAAEYGVEVEK